MDLLFEAIGVAERARIGVAERARIGVAERARIEVAGAESAVAGAENAVAEGVSKKCPICGHEYKAGTNSAIGWNSVCTSVRKHMLKWHTIISYAIILGIIGDLNKYDENELKSCFPRGVSDHLRKQLAPNLESDPDRKTMPLSVLAAIKLDQSRIKLAEENNALIIANSALKKRLHSKLSRSREIGDNLCEAQKKGKPFGHESEQLMAMYKQADPVPVPAPKLVLIPLINID
jgi:hypothetical protein